MNRKLRLAALLSAGLISLAGCASATTATPPRATPEAMTPGMVMPDGSTMGAPAPSPGASAVPADNPSSATSMICADETHTTIVKVLGLKSTPASTSSWKDHLYTCTYALDGGPLVLTVKQSADTAAAKAYFDQLRPTLGETTTLAGLGEASYGTAAGKVVLTKDNDTLMVDATALPPIVGAFQAKRADFAYQLASDILGCWTGNGS